MNLIVAVDQNWAIGKNGDLLFHLKGDMKRFRQMTTGKTVLLGRKTLESFPGEKPLPNRRNVVLTSGSRQQPGMEVVHTMAELAAAANGEPEDDVFVIGGGSVYAALLSRCRRAYITRVEAVDREADTFFPNLDKLPGWEIEKTGEAMEENGVIYRFVDYINRNIQ
jgi:dihydrofolate reductase